MHFDTTGNLLELFDSNKFTIQNFVLIFSTGHISGEHCRLLYERNYHHQQADCIMGVLTREELNSQTKFGGDFSTFF